MRAIGLVAVLLIVLQLGFATAAYAQSTPWRGVSVTLHDLSAGKEPTLVIAGTLPTDTVLPVAVAIPVPPGTEIVWLGEVFGGDGSNDIPLAYERTKGADYDLLEVTVSKAFVVQAELAVPKDWITREGQTTKIAMSWTASQEAPGVLMGFDAPAGMEVRALVPPETTSRQTASGTFYSHETLKVQPGQTLALSAELAATEATSQPVVDNPGLTEGTDSAADAGSGRAAPLLALGAVVVAAAGIGFGLLRRRGGKSAR